ncbi:MAG: DUF308 domain-containing protein [Oscillospiraceae bacterium]|nr:DUF308 domain-containing protein [Oscillospiraceae bacterium]
MKKQDILLLVNRFLAPVLVILLGLLLVLNPDSAPALIAKLLGWILIAIAIGLGISAIVTRQSTIGKGIAAVALAVVGGWLTNNPLALAAWIGRIIGILLVIDGLQDISEARKQGVQFRMPLIVTIIGAVLILLPMTTSRLVFTLCGVVVLIVGIAMLLDRLKERKQLDEPEDPNIIDAL